MRADSVYLSLFLICLLLPLTAGRPQASEAQGGRIVILANSVDLSLAGDFIEEFRGYGFDILVVHPSGFTTQRVERMILILGGPDAYEGVGGIVSSLLNSSMISEVRRPGASFLVKLKDVWRDGQLVLIAMGSDRNMTRKAYEDGMEEILSALAPPSVSYTHLTLPTTERV